MPMYGSLCQFCNGRAVSILNFDPRDDRYYLKS